jgi:hypothetical protein
VSISDHEICSARLSEELDLSLLSFYLCILIIQRVHKAYDRHAHCILTRTSAARSVTRIALVIIQINRCYIEYVGVRGSVVD